MLNSTPRTVVDLFSCGGGMSTGFAASPFWHLKAAVDLEVAKPSGKGAGETACNDIYEANHGLRPFSRDMATLDPETFMEEAALAPGDLGCLVACAPCTDFSRANPGNHLEDKGRNSLVGRCGDFVAALAPDTFVMENARELVGGNHKAHWTALRERLESLGYEVRADVEFLHEFGLPQVRQRALIIASRVGTPRTLKDLWDGKRIDPAAVTVRSALARLAEWKERRDVPDPTGDAVSGTGDIVTRRLSATPPDGGGWRDVALNPESRHLSTPECLRRWAEDDLGSHPDVYGRMWWDRPAPTVKRECAHVGNGRYAHPESNRLLTVREMATIQGFPFDYVFPTASVANRYRAIGDAVPPLIARQIAACVECTYTGRRPEVASWILPETTLRATDILDVSQAAMRRQSHRT